MVAWQTHILVHIERNDVPEPVPLGVSYVRARWYTNGAREFAVFDEADEVLVCRDGRRACGQTEHEGLVRRGVVDPIASVRTDSAPRWLAP